MGAKYNNYTIIIIRNPQNSIGNYLGPYITPCSFSEASNSYPASNSSRCWVLKCFVIPEAPATEVVGYKSLVHFISIHIYAYIHTYVNTYIYLDIYRCMYIYTYIYTYIYNCICMYINIYIYMYFQFV